MQKSVTYNMRMTPEEFAKLKQLGGVVWIRKKIKAARVPQAKQGEAT